MHHAVLHRLQRSPPAYSYRRWLSVPGQTWDYLKRERAGYCGVVGSSKSDDRAAYNSDSSGDATPHTDWISAASLAYLCRAFSNVTSRVENVDRRASLLMRDYVLKSFAVRRLGLDIYATATR